MNELFSESTSGVFSDPNSPTLPALSKQKSLNIPTISIKREIFDDQLSHSLDFKKPRSLVGTSNLVSSFAGVSKPRSRRSSFRSNDSDDEDEGNERKRRDNINDRIQELLTLIPPEFFQHDQESIINEEGEVQIKNSGTRDGKPNKGQILTNSVKYIRYLQDLIDENNKIESDLKNRLLALDPSFAVDVSSAEEALGEIGVGNYSDQYYHDILKLTLSNKVSRAGSFS